MPAGLTIRGSSVGTALVALRVAAKPSSVVAFRVYNPVKHAHADGAALIYAGAEEGLRDRPRRSQVTPVKCAYTIVHNTWSSNRIIRKLKDNCFNQAIALKPPTWGQ